jgi:hypothetical protein
LTHSVEWQSILFLNVPLVWFVLVCFTDETLELVINSAWFAHIARRWLQSDRSRAMGRQFKKKWIGIRPEFLEQSLLKKK